MSCCGISFDGKVSQHWPTLKTLLWTLLEDIWTAITATTLEKLVGRMNILCKTIKGVVLKKIKFNLNVVLLLVMTCRC